MRKISCALLIITMVIGIVPYGAFALEEQKRNTVESVMINHDEECHSCYPEANNHNKECHEDIPVADERDPINSSHNESFWEDHFIHDPCHNEETQERVDENILDHSRYIPCNEGCPSYGKPAYTEISDLIDELPPLNEVMEMGTEELLEVNRNIYVIRDKIAPVLADLGDTGHNCLDVALGKEGIDKFNDLLFYTDEYIREHVEISRTRNTGPTRLDVGVERYEITNNGVLRFPHNSSTSNASYPHNPNGYIIHGTYSRQMTTDTLSWRTVTVRAGATATLYFDNLRITNTNSFNNNTNRDLQFICVDVTGSNTTIILLDGTTNVLTGGIREGGGALVKNDGADGRTLTIACERWGEPEHMCTGTEKGLLPEGSCGRLETIGFAYHSAALGSTRDFGGVSNDIGGFGNLYIKGGIVVAYNNSADSHAPGIGSMCGTAYRRGSNVNLTNPQMLNGQISRNIHISGGRVFAYGGGNGSGIGSGTGGPVDGIYISDGAYVYARGGTNSPGIGSGGGINLPSNFNGGNAMRDPSFNVSNIIISGGRTIVEASGSHSVVSPNHTSVPGIGSGISQSGKTGIVTNVQARPESSWLALVRAGTGKEDVGYINGTPSSVDIDILPDMYYTLVYFSNATKTASVNGTPDDAGSTEEMILVRTGDRIRYTINIANWASETNSSYTLSDKIPEGMTLVTEAGSFYPEDMTIYNTDTSTIVRWENQTRIGEFFFTVTVDDTLVEDETRKYINEAVMISSIDQLEMPTNRTYHYAQWSLRYTTLTVSKEVTGDFGNRMIAFEFTILFQNSDGSLPPSGTQFHYTGEALAHLGGTAPLDGKITLDHSGRAIFQLAHGQAIHIEEVPVGSSVQIIETRDDNYQAWFTNSESTEGMKRGNDTGQQPLSEGHSFHFENVRFVAPPTGIDLGNGSDPILLLALVSIPFFAMFPLLIELKRNKSY